MQDDDDEVSLRLRALPQIQRLLEMPAASPLCEQFGHRAVRDALRATLDHFRVQMRRQRAEAPAPEVLLQRAAACLRKRAAPTLRRVINATGIAMHTNLGRAPLPDRAIDAMIEAAHGYANLEYDLETGRRSSRTGPVETVLRELTGAEAALAVNNGAAAILLALAALAGGGEVIVSRGELVEIGGGFRIPDVIQQGGARLIEVGSTNKTRFADYRDAIGPQTRAVLKVHQSNFRMTGFTAETPIAELATLTRAHALPLVADLGSGNLQGSFHGEPGVRQALAAGADLVTFSGDKLLGGPQAGLLAGRAGVIEPIRRHPLLRAVRLDKMSLAALEATLRLHRDDPGRIPVLRMLTQTPAELQARAEQLAGRLGGGDVIPTEGFAGGGALPEERIASRAVALALPGLSPEALARRLRLGRPAIVGRIIEGRFALDMLAVSADELPEIEAAVAALR